MNAPEQYEYNYTDCPHCGGRLTTDLYCYACEGYWDQDDLDDWDDINGS